MEIVTGYVEHIVFRNEENGYTVFQLESEAGEVTCVGTLNFISEGERLEIKGDYVNHNIYGSQLKISSYEMKEPEDLISIERYLGSGAIKGVGAALAGRIVRKFKTDTFRIIEEEPERLAEVNGISERKAREIALQVDEKKGMRKVMIYLQNFGISTALAAKIYQKYGSKVYEILETNPYKLADDIEGVGFKTADEIAAKIGIHTDSDFRIQSGIFYVLQQSMTEGHVYLPKKWRSVRWREGLRRGATSIAFPLDVGASHGFDLSGFPNGAQRGPSRSRFAKSGRGRRRLWMQIGKAHV